MLRSTYNWTMELASKPYALWGLFFVAFAESSFFPIPPDLLLIPLILATPKRAFYLAFICTLGSVLGAIFGYGIGMFFFDVVGEPILNFYHMEDSFASFSERFNQFGPWAVLIAGVTPFPFKVITILSGSTALNFPIFLVSCVIARSIRFFLVATLLYYIGPAAKDFIEKRLGLVFTLFCILLVGGFYLVKYL